VGSMGDRTKTMLTSLIASEQGKGGTMVPISTQGDRANHAFNLLPKDPSRAGLAPPDLGDKIDKKLVEPGKKLATTDLPVDQAVVVYEQTIRSVLEDCGESSRPLVLAAMKTLPQAAMSPEKMKAHVLASVTKHRVDDHFAKNEPGATPERIEEVRQFFAANNEKWLAPKISLAMTQNLKPPEVVLADTNWGGADTQVQFVVIPDATSGELMMFKKDVFSGKLTPAGDNWANANYYEFTD